MSFPEDTYDDTQSDAGQNAGAMSIRQWEAFRIRAVALEMAVRWAVSWDSASLDEVLDVAEAFERFLRGEVRDETAYEEEHGNGTES